MSNFQPASCGFHVSCCEKSQEHRRALTRNVHCQTRLEDRTLEEPPRQKSWPSDLATRPSPRQDNMLQTTCEVSSDQLRREHPNPLTLVSCAIRPNKNWKSLEDPRRLSGSKRILGSHMEFASIFTFCRSGPMPWPAMWAIQTCGGCKVGYRNGHLLMVLLVLLNTEPPKIVMNQTLAVPPIQLMQNTIHKAKCRKRGAPSLHPWVAQI